jgi:hypothetical protein
MYEDDLPCWEHYVKSTLVRCLVRIPNSRGNATILHVWSAHESPIPTYERLPMPHWFLRAYVSPASRLSITKLLTYLDSGYGGVNRRRAELPQAFASCI